MKMEKYIITLALLFWGVSLRTYSQNLEIEKERQIEEIIESFTESDEAANENSIDLDELHRLADRPLNVNAATAEELEKLLFLDFGQITGLLSYRNKYGPVKTIYELSVIDGFDEETIRKIRPFIFFGENADITSLRLKRIAQRAYLRAKTSFPEGRGFSSSDSEKPSAYSGAPVSYYFRYKVEVSKRIEFGITADNDAGEPFFKTDNRQGFDFYSGHVVWRGTGLVRQINLGDYHLRFGQGLSYWTGGGFNKSVESINIMRSGQGVKPYTSTDENSFFRGGAITLALKPAKLILFYSNKRRDANIDEDDDGNPVFTSLQTSGLHRTNSERADENSIRESLAGLYSELRFERLRLGITAVHEQFNLPMEKGDALYRSKSFEGKENFNLGFDYQWALRRLQFFGEAGLSKSMRAAVTQGAVWRLHPQLSLSFCYRYLDPGFHTFYGNALSEGSGNRNERGFFTGFELLPLKKIRITGYIDTYHFPWLTYSTSAPGHGNDLMFQINYQTNQQLDFSIRVKYETKPQKESDSTGIPSDFDETTGKIRLQSNWQVSDKLTLKHRLEYCDYHYNTDTESGYLLFQDLVYTVNSHLNCWIRYCWYHTDGYNSRIYAYENDLLHYYSIPAFYGEGSRVYLNLRWEPLSSVSLYFKAGCTIRQGVDSMGSGYDETPGNRRTEVRALLYLKF